MNVCHIAYVSVKENYCNNEIFAKYVSNFEFKDRLAVNL